MAFMDTFLDPILGDGGKIKKGTGQLTSEELTANLNNVRGVQEHLRKQGPTDFFSIDPTQQAQMRAGQMDLINNLSAVARGTAGPSVAEMQMRRGLEDNQRAALGMALNTDGVSPAAGLRAAMMQNAMAGQRTVADTAMLRAEEANAARALMGQALGQARGQDIGLATDQASMANQAAQFNAQNDLQRQQLLSQLADQMFGMYSFNPQQQMAVATGNAQLSGAKRGQNMQAFGATASAVGGGLAQQQQK